jgi:hypothetical protein
MDDVKWRIVHASQMHKLYLSQRMQVFQQQPMGHEGGNDVEGRLVEQCVLQRRQMQFVVLHCDRDWVGYHHVYSLVCFLIVYMRKQLGE